MDAALFLRPYAVGIRCCSRYELPGLWADWEEILCLLFVLTGTYSYTFLAAAGSFRVHRPVFMLWAIRRLVKRFFGLGADRESVSRHIVSKWGVPRAESRGYRRRTGLSMLLHG
ncbi:MAG: hypothetical protein ACLUIQ_09180 [Dialister invisus]